MFTNDRNDLRNAMTKREIAFDISHDDYTIEYRTRFNEMRYIRHVTYNDALQRAHVLRARAYRDVRVYRTFY